MKQLDAARLREVLFYSVITGEFYWLKPYRNQRPVGSVAGTINARGYRWLMVDGVAFSAHRGAWLYITGEWPQETEDIDHENGVAHHNGWHNLRCGSTSFNMQNQRRAVCTNRSGLLGAWFNKRLGKYLSGIRVEGRIKHLGVFDTAQEAHEAHLAARREHYPGNTL